MSDAKPQTVEQLQAQVGLLQRELHWSQLNIQVLEEKLRQQRIKMFGRRSEKLSDLQLWLLELEPSEVAGRGGTPARRAGGAADHRERPGERRDRGGDGDW